MGSWDMSVLLDHTLMCWVLFVQKAGCLAPLMGSGGLWSGEGVRGTDTGLSPAPAGDDAEGRIPLCVLAQVPTQSAITWLGGP